MRYTFNFPISDISKSSKNIQLNIRDAINGYSQYYQFYSPVNLIFETCHPDDSDVNYIISGLTPELAFSSTLSKDEANTLISNHSLHQHNYYELLYVISGELYQKIEDQRHLYTAGSICLLNKNCKHSEEFSTDYRAAFLSLSEEVIEDVFQHNKPFYFKVEQQNVQTLLSEFFSHNIKSNKDCVKEYIDFIPIMGNLTTQKNMYQIFEQLTLLLSNQSIGSTHILRGLILTLFHTLDNPDNYQTTPIKLGKDFENSIFKQITQLMEEKDGRITRRELENILNYKGDYLNKIVKKHTGLSIFNYGLTFCLKKAEDLLINSSQNIADIACSLKFTNRAHFYKLFHEVYGLTPKEYRKKHQDN